MAPPRKKKDPKPTLDEEPDITVEESDPDTTVEEADPNLTVSVDDITIEESDHEASIDGNATDTESSEEEERQRHPKASSSSMWKGRTMHQHTSGDEQQYYARYVQGANGPVNTDVLTTRNRNILFVRMGRAVGGKRRKRTAMQAYIRKNKKKLKEMTITVPEVGSDIDDVDTSSEPEIEVEDVDTSSEPEPENDEPANNPLLHGPVTRTRLANMAQQLREHQRQVSSLMVRVHANEDIRRYHLNPVVRLETLPGHHDAEDIGNSNTQKNKENQEKSASVSRSVPANMNVYYISSSASEDETEQVANNNVHDISFSASEEETEDIELQIALEKIAKEEKEKEEKNSSVSRSVPAENNDENGVVEEAIVISDEEFQEEDKLVDGRFQNKKKGKGKGKSNTNQRDNNNNPDNDTETENFQEDENLVDGRFMNKNKGKGKSSSSENTTENKSQDTIKVSHQNNSQLIEDSNLTDSDSSVNQNVPDDQSLNDSRKGTEEFQERRSDKDKKNDSNEGFSQESSSQSPRKSNDDSPTRTEIEQKKEKSKSPNSSEDSEFALNPSMDEQALFALAENVNENSNSVAPAEDENENSNTPSLITYLGLTRKPASTPPPWWKIGTDVSRAPTNQPSTSKNRKNRKNRKNVAGKRSQTFSSTPVNSGSGRVRLVRLVSLDPPTSRNRNTPNAVTQRRSTVRRRNMSTGKAKKFSIPKKSTSQNLPENFPDTQEHADSEELPERQDISDSPNESPSESRSSTTTDDQIHVRDQPAMSRSLRKRKVVESSSSNKKKKNAQALDSMTDSDKCLFCKGPLPCNCRLRLDNDKDGNTSPDMGSDFE